jgi:primosomal protein N' (replication factor Y) (superfamily II helicase)
MAPAVVNAIAVNLPGADSFDFYADCALDAGRLVLVPWGNGKRVGTVLQGGTVAQIEAQRIKPVFGAVNAWPVLPAPVMELARFAAGYYQRGVGEVLLNAIPEPLTRAADYTLQNGAACFTKLKRAKRFAAALSGAAMAAPALNSEQVAALTHITAQPGYAAHLLFGVTGSGKTEVYLHAAQAVLARGQRVLMLVPEIALTENLSAQVIARFPNVPVARMTSALSDGERALGWLDALQGTAQIVIGTRSAVFAPLSNVGLIIVDEEHDASYKQSEGARWHGRDLAVMRARLENCPVVLGSATPSLESWANAQAQRYTLLRLAQRANTAAKLPGIELVPPAPRGSEHGLSERMLAALAGRLQAGEQSLVFLNRRGYAPVLSCDACGWLADCDNCSAHLALHRARNKSGYQLICHHCSAHRAVPIRCPQCGNADLLPKGRGTQKLEDTLAQALPAARVARMDADTTRKRGAGAQLLQDMDQGNTDILVGTQMTAKGHDFARLTLVGVLGADQSLTSPDFRGEERLFALLMQVAGRAGRADKPGEVLIETTRPRHLLFAALKQQDYEAVATRLLLERQELQLPPYVSFALLRASAKSDAAAQSFLQDARALASTPHHSGAQENRQAGELAGILLYHPMPQAVPRVANQARWQLLAQATSRAQMQSFLKPWLAQVAALNAKNVRWHIDVDPLEL